MIPNNQYEPKRNFEVIGGCIDFSDPRHIVDEPAKLFCKHCGTSTNMYEICQTFNHHIYYAKCNCGRIYHPGNGDY
jgi:hypothetical protein